MGKCATGLAPASWFINVVSHDSHEVAEIACQSLQMVLMNFRFLAFGVTDYAGRMTTCHCGAVAAKEPRDAEVRDACRLLDRRLAEWVAVVANGRKDQHPLAKPESRTLPG